MLRLVLTLAVILIAPFARAEDIRVAQHAGYGRAVFDWPTAIQYDVQKNGNRVFLQFARPIEDNVQKLMALSTYISGLQVLQGGQTLLFDVQPGVEVSDFVLQNRIVVLDFKRSQPAAPATAPVAPVAPTPAPAAAPVNNLPNLVVRTGEHNGYHRIVFDWPQPTDYVINRSGDDLLLAFKGNGTFDVPALQRKLPNNAGDVQIVTQRPLTVRLPLLNDRRFRHFVSNDRSVVVDLLNEGDEPPAVSAPTEKVAAQKQQLPPAVAENAPKPQGNPPEKTPAKAETASAATASEKGQTETPAPPQQAAEEQATTSPALPTPTQKSTAAAPAPDADSTPDTALRKFASLSFPWTKPVGAAVFRRAGYVWVVFDEYEDVDIKLQRRLGQGIIRFIEQVPHGKATVLRMITEEGFNVSLRREGLLWVVDLLRQPNEPRTPIMIRTQDRSAVGPRILADMQDAGNVTRIVDPSVGDELVVIPTEVLGAGVSPGYVFPQLTILPSVQGLGIVSRSDELDVLASRTGVEISAGGGVLFSSAADRVITGKQSMEGSPANLLNIKAWALGTEEGGEPYWNALQNLIAAAGEASQDLKSQKRLDLARFYFAHSLYAEALGQIELILQDDPQLEFSPAIRIIRGASNYMMGRYDDAADDLGHESLANNGEATFWRAAVLSSQGAMRAQADKFAANSGVIYNYPKEMRKALALLAAEANIEAGNDIAATNFLEAAEDKEADADHEAAHDYLQGRLQESVGAFEKAVETWEAVMETDNRLYSALATWRHAELMLKLGRMEPEQVMEALEGLRFSWRGGAFEYALLKRLSELYLEHKKYRDGMEVLRLAASYFRDQPGVGELTRRLRQTFEKLFHDGAADALDPVQAIALFEDFRELTPGGERGNTIIRRLADRLVSVDMLDEAENLLFHQIRSGQVKGLERSRVGSRLALVYLLNKKPVQALEVLNKTERDAMPADLKRQRSLLRSKALAANNRIDMALKAIAGIQDKEADMLRSEIYMQDKRWSDLAETLEKILPEPSLNMNLTDSQAYAIVMWAVALSNAENEPALAALRRRYIIPMRKTDYIDAFDFYTAPPSNGVPDYRALDDKILQTQNFQQFLSSYREKLKTDKLSLMN